MKPNHFPEIRKAPFAVVLFPLLALIMASCTSEEGSEYDIPAGEQVRELKLEVDADGTPVLLAEVGMFYTTKARLQPWEGKYIQANSQSIVYSGTAGGWKQHPFRNVRRGWDINSMLMRNAKDGVHALISDRDKLSLFARAGGDWSLKASYKVANNYEIRTDNVLTGGQAVLMEGDGAWQSLIDNYKSGRMEVRRNDGTSFALDTLLDFTPLSLVSREGFNMVLGNQRNSWRGSYDPDSPPPLDTGVTGLFSYAWSLDAKDPNPRKRKISDRKFFRLFFAKVQGEDRMYALALPDTLAEFAMKGDELAFLRDVDLPIHRDFESKLDARPDGVIPYGADLLVDPTGCIHYMSIGYETSNDSGQSERPFYSHGSTCRAGVDTLKLPAPDTIHTYESLLTPFRFSPDGGIMAGLLVTRAAKVPSNYIEGASPSWIYLARLKGRTWEWEKIAEFEGSGED